MGKRHSMLQPVTAAGNGRAWQQRVVRGRHGRRNSGDGRKGRKGGGR